MLRRLKPAGVTHGFPASVQYDDQPAGLTEIVVMQRSPNNPRRGIVLLLVLGMLSLFTVLIISFVVFSSQSAATSASNRVKSETVIPIKMATQTALEQLVSGTSNHRSALYRNSLLEDVYGGSYQMRVGHSRPNPSRPANAPLAARTPGGLLLLPLDEGTGEPQTTLFKVPTNLVPWNEPGAAPAPGASTITPTNRLFFMWEQRPDLDDSFTGRLVTFDEGPLRGSTFRVIRSFGNRNGEPQVPRQGFSGPQTQPNRNDLWPNPAGVPTHPDYADPSLYSQAEYDLAGNFVIDLSERPEETIEIDGIIQQLYLVANNTPNALLFHPGPDGAPGALGVDDNGNGTVDDLGELGRPGSDDYGYRFTLNGAPFRGRGRNASGNNGLVREDGNNIDPAAAIELQFNDRLIGPGSHADVDGLLERAEPNESHDAADFDNLFLAFQPSDHRRELNSQVYDPLRVFDAEKFNRNIGSKIIPSFHRPSVINYLMNAPIYLRGENPNTAPRRNFASIETSPDTSAPALDHERLAVLIQRIRRATMRPLNVTHFASYLPNGPDLDGDGEADDYDPDLDGDGEAYDGAPGFTGSSEHPFLTKTLNLAIPDPTDPDFGNAFSTLVADTYNLATWLVNGPWDIDNDGDGLPDSVWVDLDVANTVAPDGTLIRPIYAFLIEDVDGKIDLNHAGSYAHAVEPAHQDGPYDTSDFSDYRLLRRYNETNYGLVARSLDSFGFGGGLGPAEINFSHLFQDHDPRLSIAAADPYNGPLTLNQLSPRAAFLNDNSFPNVPASSNFGLLRTRYGNLLNTRYGGNPYDYLGKSNTSYPGPDGIYLPASGTGANPLVQTSTLSRIMFPARRGNLVGVTNRTAYGRPMDMHGVVKTRPSVLGDEEITVPSVLVDRPTGTGVTNIGINNVANQPYEFGATQAYGDDKPFTPAEYVDFLRGGPLGGRLSQLLGDAAERNPALKNQLGIDSRSFDVPEIPGHTSFVQLLAARLGETGRVAGEGPALAPAVQQSHLDRMLAVELRKGSKLNLNRAIGNGANDNPGANTIVDESFETDPLLPTSLFYGAPRMRQAQELAFQQLIGINFTNVNANYTPYYVPQANFGTPDFQDDVTDLTLAQPQYKAATGGELLARHLYVLMFTLIVDRDSVDGVLVRNFPYPSANFSDANARNLFVARRLAQWAVNAVDFRDTNAACTRLRFDPNPFDGWDPAVAARNTVWGMEHPELAITEAFAMHDKRVKSNIPELTAGGAVPESPENVDQDADNDGDPRTGTVPDSDMDQFRAPEATAIVEIKNLRTPRAGRLDTATARGGLNQTLLPRDLYDANDRLDLSAVAVDPANPDFNSPVWRLAVSEPIDNDGNKSVRWLYDARRLGGDLEVFLNGREDELNHLRIDSSAGSAIDWLMDDDSDLQDARDLLDEGALHGLDVRNVPYDAANPFPEAVTIADDFQNSNTNGEHRLQLERFVWFTPRATLSPANANLNILTAAQSAMRQNNVYVNQGELTPGGDSTTDGAGRVLLEPGAYAVVAPRASTIMGQTNQSNQANNYQYYPVRQRFEFRNLGGVINGANAFGFDYFNIGTNNPMTPTYVDPSDLTANHRVQNVVPIIAQSLYPHEVGAPAPAGSIVEGWAMSPTPVAERVDMGFNISAPLPGEAYYPVPTNRINLAGVDPDGNPNAGYPLVDGYYDYDAPGADRHPDIPFDHQTGRPLADNAYDVPDDSGNLVSVSWNSVGTHQDARAVFLQRLADPTRPWHHIDNPYLTMDFSPIDLTTMNGEEDVTQLVDRNNDGDTNDPEDHFVDAGRGINGAGNELDTTGGTKYDGNFFAPYVKFDSRRKIPNVDKDRVATQMQCLGSSDPTDINNYQHVEMVKRSWMTTRYNVLRRTADAGTSAYWDREVGSMWDNGAITPAAGGLDTRHAVDLAATMDARNAGFTQSLGFLNREFGIPTALDEQTLSLSGVSGQIIDLSNPAFGRHFVGSPQGVMLTLPHWLDRDFESPLDLINVPAVSRIGMSYSFGPGTRYDDVNTKLRELPVRFGHLLGFEFEFNIERGYDTDTDSSTNTTRYQFYSPQDVRTVDVDGDNQYFTGGRAGFEQIFDYVDVGPVWFDSQRWFDTAKVTARDQSFVAGKPAGVQARYQLAVPLFNRAVATLQPPYNYISKHRTPGKVNLNTMPDYVTKGPGVLNDPTLVNDFLDYGESAENPKLLSPTGQQPLYLSSSPYNNNLDSNLLSAEYRGNSRLFGSGSIFRALNWAGSTPFELDSFIDDNGFERPIYGSPSIIGDHNRYEEAVDTQFGRSFKAFIESRRGYDGTQRVAGATAGAVGLRNPYLDWRYPTQFAGLFSVGRASSSGSVQRFMRTPNAPDPVPGNPNPGVVRRVSEMGLLRPHPDFSNRLITDAVRTAHGDSATTPPLYSLGVGKLPTADGTLNNTSGTKPDLAFAQPRPLAEDLEISMLKTRLFERPQAELHSNFRSLDHNPYYKYKDTARLANLTTHHSNVYLVRMTVGFFVVDPRSNAITTEYVNSTGKPIRSKSTFMIDRSIPVGFAPGKALNSLNTVIYSEVDQ
ncbi:hypothetical protein SV7mr_27660 [Stieleria bergensis]|uniref:Uncharacterized protein n=2 Tax=Stieleria bergensis TaxID=2528025 RepID=A0A517SVU1_9BACT|nr:hypothetical protein SV7mr_27660 [Planctomycetes bacterium SV_7m_r]